MCRLFSRAIGHALAHFLASKRKQYLSVSSRFVPNNSQINESHYAFPVRSWTSACLFQWCPRIMPPGPLGPGCVLVHMRITFCSPRAVGGSNKQLSSPAPALIVSSSSRRPCCACPTCRSASRRCPLPRRISCAHSGSSSALRLVLWRRRGLWGAVASCRRPMSAAHRRIYTRIPRSPSTCSCR